MEIFWSIVISILAGAAGAMGIGGGSVFLLYLTAFAGLDQMKAQGINLVFFIPIAVIALVIHCRNHLVRWRTALLCLLAGIPAVFPVVAGPMPGHAAEPSTRCHRAGPV